MKRSAPLLLVGLLSSVAAQVTFQRTYGGTDADYGASVALTADGGYIITGGTDSYGAGGGDVCLTKTDAVGDTVWLRTYGGTDADCGTSVAPTADGGYVITGGTNSYGAGGGDVWLIKTDAVGDTQWTRTFGSAGYDYGSSVAPTADSGYIITGATAADVALIKTDAEGGAVWTRTFGGEDYDDGRSVAQTADGGYIISGYTNSFGAGWADFWLIKADAAGDTQWTRTLGGTDDDMASSVAPTADGGYLVTGYTRSLGAGRWDAWLIRTDALGDTVWTRTFGGAGWDFGCSAIPTADGGCVVAGWTMSFGAGSSDVYLIKTDVAGDTAWTRTFGGTECDDGLSVAQTTDGGYVITGSSQSFGAGDYDVYLIKTDSLGRVGVAEREPAVASQLAQTSLVRGALPVKHGTAAVLLDISGRKVMDLRPGENDIRHLAPGVFFVMTEGSPQARRVVIAK